MKNSKKSMTPLTFTDNYTHEGDPAIFHTYKLRKVWNKNVAIIIINYIAQQRNAKSSSITIHTYSLSISSPSAKKNFFFSGDERAGQK